MANVCSLWFYCILSILIATLSRQCGAIDEDRKVYIVYMGSLPEGEYSPTSDHLSILQEVLESSLVGDSLVRSYKRSFNGFAAKLTNQQRQRIASMQGVVSVFPSRTLQLQTTRSWDFMGLSETVKRSPSVESNVIIGVIDTGVWPESDSFSDEGFGPAPKKWKGICKGGSNFTCNNKLIGARYYTPDRSARDTEGHGSHTASTAAGNKVTDTSFYGLAQGNARGGVPSSRIAVYKVCAPEMGCDEAAILAAFDDAIADGVDILTISIGGSAAVGFKGDSIAIGAFHAMQNGVLTMNSAGNSGPGLTSVASVAPWMLTVAAASTDRRIIDKVVLGDGTAIVGISVNSFTMNGTKFPLINGEDASTSCERSSAQVCSDGCLDSSLVKGKIVVCEDSHGAIEAVRADALGSITSGSSFSDVAFIVPLPASLLSDIDQEKVKSYMTSTKNPQAQILKSEATKDFAAPVVASFSSRGPNTIAEDILKPDISAPGIDILAAYSPDASLTESDKDTRSVKYSILSGTSMACPHVAGAAAYVKTFNPDWSPSAIKSALMTTAWPMNATNNPEGEFAYGAGHIDPVKAVNPGLVYEALKADYINFLCSMGYDTEMVRIISGDNSSCPKDVKGTPKDLNYPSLAAKVKEDEPFTLKFSRTVTNVGAANSTYKATVTSGSKIKVSVEPSVLTFKSLNEKQSFVVTVVGRGLSLSSRVSASLVWSDGTHSVRSPIVVYTLDYSE